MDTCLHQEACTAGQAVASLSCVQRTMQVALIRQLIWAADRDSDLLRPFFRLFGKDPKAGKPGMAITGSVSTADRRRDDINDGRRES